MGAGELPPNSAGLTPTRKVRPVHHPHLRPLHRHPHGSMNKRLDAYLRETDPRLYQIKNYPMLGVAFPWATCSFRAWPSARAILRDGIQHDLNSMKRRSVYVS